MSMTSCAAYGEIATAGKLKIDDNITSGDYETIAV